MQTTERLLDLLLNRQHAQWQNAWKPA
jgi:hypothetical protein